MAGRMFPVASTASVSGWVASIEVALRFAMFAALIYATLGFMPRADVSPVILSGHSLGVNVAHTVAGHLERMGIDVFAIVALDPPVHSSISLAGRRPPGSDKDFRRHPLGGPAVDIHIGLRALSEAASADDACEWGDAERCYGGHWICEDAAGQQPFQPGALTCLGHSPGHQRGHGLEMRDGSQTAPKQGSIQKQS
ncbi:unnamed protein product [Symbiodinium natans]|uniref:Uncharacterized protein n=1 Tax=Symbiodinium natans TaxID=878477 RepID=A0A812JKX6_9DINO|nr:unnamed protein product [Symbiodinium natans]